MDWVRILARGDAIVMNRNWLVLFSLAVLSGCGNCGGKDDDDDSTQACTPGSTQTCVCSHDTQGVQRCKDDGSGWDECTNCTALHSSSTTTVSGSTSATSTISGTSGATSTTGSTGTISSTSGASSHATSQQGKSSSSEVLPSSGPEPSSGRTSSSSGTATSTATSHAGTSSSTGATSVIPASSGTSAVTSSSSTDSSGATSAVLPSSGGGTSSSATSGQCTPGESTCLDPYSVAYCVPNPATPGVNSYGNRVPCALGDACQNGYCVHQSCMETQTMLVLDRSSSMLQGNTWQWVKAAFIEATLRWQARNFLGLRQLPGSLGGCTVSDSLAPARNNGNVIANAIRDPDESSSTPIAAALRGLDVYGDHMDGEALILFTDGEESCGSVDDALSAASALLRSGVRVYVIALTTMANTQFLDRLAAAGGTGLARHANNGTELLTAVDEIFAELDGCLCTPDVTYACSNATQSICTSNGMNLESRACPTDPNGTATCKGTTCGIDCYANALSCNGACAVCPDNATQTACNGAACVATACQSGWHVCNGQCVSNDNADHCGSRCDPCPGTPNGDAICINQMCTIQCQPSYHLCGNECVSNNDVAHCGSLCTPCPTDPNGASTCDGNSCGIECSFGFHDCNGTCVSNYSTDSCGSVCVACPAGSQATPTCDGTTCGISCPEDYHQCGYDCAYNNDSQSCGDRCAPCYAPAHGYGTCTNGTCGFSCYADYRDCGGLDCVLCPKTGVQQTSCNGDACVATQCVPGYQICGTECCPSWSIETIDGDVYHNERVSLAFDAADQPRVSYASYTQLLYAWRTGTAWTKEATGAYSAEDNAVVLDASGKPSIIRSGYNSANKMCTEVLTRDGSWTTSTLNTHSGGYDMLTNPNVAITIGGDGARHIIYNGSYEALTYAVNRSGSWTTTTLNPKGSLDLAAAIQGGLYPVLFGYDLELNNYRLLANNGTSWSTDVIEQSSPCDRSGLEKSVRCGAMALKTNGTPVACYLHTTGLRCAVRAANGWNNQTVLEGSQLGDSVSLAVDVNGNWHVALHDYQGTPSWDRRGALRYGHMNASTSTWSWELVDAELDRDVGLFASLALKTDGTPCIAYYRDSQLRLACKP